MIFDIVVAAAVVVMAWRTAQLGGMAAIWQLLTVLGSGVAARLLAKPSAAYIVKAVAWPLPFAVGVAFVTYFLVIWMAARFAMGQVIESASENHGDGGSLDRFTGFLFGVGRASLVVYFLLMGTILLTQRLGAQKSYLAFQYQNSRVGRWVMTHNIVDPEPFPNAFVLRVLVGSADNAVAPRPQALYALGENPKTQALLGDAQSVELIRAGNWKQLRRRAAALDMVTDPGFLRAADNFLSPVHAVKAEEPSERFKELESR